VKGQQSLLDMVTALEVLIDQNQGEIDASVEALEGDIKQKTDAIVFYYRKLKAQTEAKKNLASALRAEAATSEERAERLRANMLAAFKRLGVKSLETPSGFRPHLTTAERVVVPPGWEDDETNWHLCRLKREPNKTAIKDLLDAGVAAGGCSIELTESVVMK
jgi:hypothetical protein